MVTHKSGALVFRPIGKGIEMLGLVDGSRAFSRLFGPQHADWSEALYNEDRPARRDDP